MAAEGKRRRPEEGFYKAVEDGVPLERAKKYIGKVEKKMFYPIEVSTCYLCCAFHMQIKSVIKYLHEAYYLISS